MNTKGLLRVSKREFMAVDPSGSKVVGRLRLLGPGNKLSCAAVAATLPDGSLQAEFHSLQAGRSALIEIADARAIGLIIRWGGGRAINAAAE